MVFLLGIAFLALLVPLFMNQVNDLIDALPVYIESVSTNLNEWFNLDISTESLQEEAAGLPNIIVGAGGTILGGVVSVTTGIFSFLFFVTTVALFSFYMVAELPKLQRTILSTMKPDRQRDALHIWDVAVEKMGGYIYSRLILSLLSGTLTAVFLTILGVPFAVSLGIWVGVLSQFIPVVGTYLAAILPAVVALSSGGLGTMLWVILYFVAYQQIENYLIAASDHSADHGDPSRRLDRGDHHRVGAFRAYRGDPGSSHGRNHPGSHLRDQKPSCRDPRLRALRDSDVSRAVSIRAACLVVVAMVATSCTAEAEPTTTLEVVTTRAPETTTTSAPTTTVAARPP